MEGDYLFRVDLRRTNFTKIAPIVLLAGVGFFGARYGCEGKPHDLEITARITQETRQEHLTRYGLRIESIDYGQKSWFGQRWISETNPSEIQKMLKHYGPFKNGQLIIWSDKDLANEGDEFFVRPRKIANGVFDISGTYSGTLENNFFTADEEGTRSGVAP